MDLSSNDISIFCHSNHKLKHAPGQKQVDDKLERGGGTLHRDSATLHHKLFAVSPHYRVFGRVTEMLATAKNKTWDAGCSCGVHCTMNILHYPKQFSSGATLSL